MTNPRILYVDDDDGLRRLTQRALARRGFDVETAASADEGLARIREGAVDLAAIDQTMPGKDGLAMLREIVALPDYPPVVFVTGTDEPQVAVTALTSGATDFVIKTVGEDFFDLLAGRLRQALDRVALQRAKRKAEEDLREANQQLEMLVREVHHRVSNSLQMVLSFVSMQANQTSDPAASAALADTQNRIRAIAKVHHRLYTRDDLSTIDLDEYLRTLVSELRGTLGDNAERIHIELRAEPVEVPPDTAVSVGVIVNELLSNAAKYAFGPEDDGQITVELTAGADGGFSVCVSDNGRGMDATEAPQGTGLGSRIVTAIARSLDTTVETEPQARGTRMRVTVQPRRH